MDNVDFFLVYPNGSINRLDGKSINHNFNDFNYIPITHNDYWVGDTWNDSPVFLDVPAPSTFFMILCILFFIFLKRDRV